MTSTPRLFVHRPAVPRILRLGILLWTLPAVLWGLDPERSLDRSLVHQWSTDRGLLQVSVTAIEQDAVGYLWIATLEGLARFDGLSFAGAGDLAGGLASEPATALAFGRQGDLWIGTLGAGLRWRAGTQAPVLAVEELPDGRVNDLLSRPDGTILVATGRGLVAVRDGVVFERWPTQTPTTALEVSGDGTTWVGTSAGLRQLGAQGLEPVPLAGAIEGVPLRDLLWMRGALWIGTLGNGLGRLDDQGLELLGAEIGIHNAFVSTLAAEGDCLWIGTRGGLYRRCGSEPAEAFPVGHPLADAAVLDLLVDRQGDVWVGTQTLGLVRLQDAPITALAARNGLDDTMVSSVSQNLDGEVLVATTGAGVSALDLSAGTARPLSPEQTGQRTTAVLPTGPDTVWIGTSGAGLFERRGDSVVRHGTATGALASDFILSLFEDSLGALWVGTNTGGVSRYEAGEWSTWGTQEGLPTVAVMAFAEDSDAGIWIATQRGLVHSADRGRSGWREVELPYKLLTALAADDDGVLWIGTLGGGLLLRETDGTIHRVGTAQGLPRATLWTVLQLGADLWMSSNHGVWRVPRQELLAVARGGGGLPGVTVLDADDGMPASECNGGTQPAGWVTRDGRLLFPTIAGVAVVDPARLEPATAPAAAVIEGLRSDGQSRQLATPLAIAAGTRTLEIDYTAVALRDPRSVRFRYRLEGYDADWVEAGSRRAAYYTRVPPGSYRFRVEAGRSGAPWVASAPLRLVFAPQWHQRRSVRWGGALFVLGLLATTLNLRLRAASARRRELERLVDERTEALRDANQRLEQLASKDGLTGLATRRRFDEQLAEEWKRHARDQEPLAVVLADVDAFKLFNDSQGHVAGDECLRRVAALFSENARRAGDVAARYGGEELVLLLPGVAAAGAREIAESLRRSVVELGIEHPASPVVPVVTVSLGVASQVPQSDSSPTKLVEAADRALYRAKNAGRNQVAGD